MNMLRALKRNVAKNKMKKEGMTKICKHSHTGPGWHKIIVPSVFARRWKDYV